MFNSTITMRQSEGNNKSIADGSTVTRTTVTHKPFELSGLLPIELGVELPGLGEQLALGRVVGIHDDRPDDLSGHVGVVMGRRHLCW